MFLKLWSSKVINLAKHISCYSYKSQMVILNVFQKRREDEYKTEPS